MIGQNFKPLLYPNLKFFKTMSCGVSYKSKFETEIDNELLEILCFTMNRCFFEKRFLYEILEISFKLFLRNHIFYHHINF